MVVEAVFSYDGHATPQAATWPIGDLLSVTALLDVDVFDGGEIPMWAVPTIKAVAGEPLALEYSYNVNSPRQLPWWDRVDARSDLVCGGTIVVQLPHGRAYRWAGALVRWLRRRWGCE